MLLRLLPGLLILPACSGGVPPGEGDDDSTLDSAAPPSTGETGSAPSCQEDPPTLEIGTGAEAFVPITELGPVDVIHGSQGGYHMVTAVRVCHMDPLVTVHIQLTEESTSTVMADVFYPAPTYDEGDCCRWRGDMWGILDVSNIPGAQRKGAGEYLDGKVVVFDLTVTDKLGNEVSDSVRVTARYEP